VEGFFLLIPVFIVIAIVIRLAAGGMDHDRIKKYVEERGGTVLDSNWSPFGPGWFGEKSDRIYGVRYLDKDGNEHEAHCKTSMWTGVYFTEDRIVKYAKRPTTAPTPTKSALEAENRRLREELERVRRQQGNAEPGAAADGGGR
jgi:hypothetical protein